MKLLATVFHPAIYLPYICLNIKHCVLIYLAKRRAMSQDTVRKNNADSGP